MTYPVYIDPLFRPAGNKASAWTQIDKGYPNARYWNEKSDLQDGYCDYQATDPQCKDVNVAKSFIQIPVPSALHSDTTVESADLYMTDDWSASPCGTKTPAQLWTTGSISKSTTWNNAPSWNTQIEQESFTFGHSGCASYDEDVTWGNTELTSILQHDAANNYTTQTFGIEAASQTDDTQWKQWANGSSGQQTYLSVTYADPPDLPTDRTTSPGGSCKYKASDAPVIGNDDLTFYTKVSDNDGAGEGLSTRFVILNSDGTVAYNSANHGTNFSSGNNATAQLLLNRSVMQNLHTDSGTREYTYHWYAITTDTGSGLSSPAPADDCYFTYNPVGPAAPTVTAPAGGQLGQPVTVTFTKPSVCGQAGQPCPVSYVYQLGSSAPVTVTASPNGGNWTGTITLNQVGPVNLTVYGMAAGGNPGEAAIAPMIGTAPQTPYKDGYFSGGTYPDFLTTGTGPKPSLWLYTGTGNGTLNAVASDIGSLGTHVTPGSDGPGDWSGATVLHGNFTGDNVQDIMAYYPAGPYQGNGIVINGTGTSSALQPDSGGLYNIEPGDMVDPANNDDPTQLVAAGNASGLGTGTDDLIGIAGDPTSGVYELDLYTNGWCTGCAGPGGYTYYNVLAPTGTDPTIAPDGTMDWNNYSLATAQPGGTPSGVVLFALNQSTGALYESASPGQLMTAENWTKLTTPWGATPPTLASADISSTGSTELWGTSGSHYTSYTLSGTTLSTENTGTFSTPAHEWPFTDGDPLAQTSTATTATDTVSGTPATLNGTAAWGADDYFSTDIALDSTGYVTPPATTIPSSATTPKISLWFKTTTTTGGVLASIQASALSTGTTTTGSYDPVLYIGTDGKLYGEWWNGTASPIASATTVNDGLWHHAVLTSYGTTQTLYLDNQTGITKNGTTTLTPFNPTNLTLGAGYIGGNWPAQPHHGASTGTTWYYTGEIASTYYGTPIS